MTFLADQEDNQKIRKAAKECRTTMSTFVLWAAIDRAQKVLSPSTVTPEQQAIAKPNDGQ